MIRNVYSQLRAPDRDTLIDMHQVFLARNWGTVPTVSPGEPLAAYVNDNRWVADCPCGSGVLCAPTDPDGRCFQCGLVHQIVFPAADLIAAADAVLSERPREFNRHWRPDIEQVADLAVENAVHGLAGGLEETA